MTASELVPATLPEAPSLPITWRGRAFGVEVESNRSVASVGPPDGAALGRRVRLELSPPGSLRRAFPRGAPVLVERWRRPGRPMVRVEADPAQGFHIWAPGHGRHIVSPDGATVRSSVPGLAGRRWERLLLAQPLPLAAVLQGLELLHASAVRLERGMVAFVASSGTGKTSVAAHLVAGGASFVTDDILAVEPSGDGVVAHAGGRVLHLADSELADVAPAGRSRLRLLDGGSDKLQVGARVSTEPAPLAAIYFLERSGAFDRLEIVRLSPPPPTLLLSGAFLTYLSLPSRLERQLDLCARLAESVPVFRAQAPARYGAARLAEAVSEHAEREL